MGLWVVKSVVNIVLVLVFWLDVSLMVEMMIQLVMTTSHIVELVIILFREMNAFLFTNVFM
jgi:hypothetical protein